MDGIVWMSLQCVRSGDKADSALGPEAAPELWDLGQVSSCHWASAPLPERTYPKGYHKH